MITTAIENPDKRFEQQEPQGSIKCIKNFGDRALHVVATYLPEEKKWLVISAWIQGEENAPSFEQELVLSPIKLIWTIGKLIWKLIRSGR